MKTKELVKMILTHYESSRESKALLQSLVWEYECAQLGIETLEGFFQSYEAGQLSNGETIRRQACKFQEENPELRATEETQLINAKLAEVIRQNGGEL